MTLFSRIPAPRKRLRVPVRYRVQSDGRWYCGTTENVSRSGVLIRVDTPVREAAQIDVILKLPARLLETAPCEIVCGGTVARVADSTTAGPQVGVEFDEAATSALDPLIGRL